MWVGQLPLKLSSVTVLAYAPDGRTLYSGDSKGKVLAWDVSTRTHRALYRRPKTGNRGVYTLWPTPDGARVLCADDDEIVDVLHPDSGPLLRAKKREREWGSRRIAVTGIVSSGAKRSFGRASSVSGDSLAASGAPIPRSL